MWNVRRFLAALVFLAGMGNASAGTLTLDTTRADDPAALAASMPGFATRVLAAYREEDEDRRLANTMRLQLVAGDYSGALDSIHAVRRVRAAKGDPQAPAAFMVNEIYATAMRRSGGGAGFEAAFGQAFDDRYGRLDDRSALALQWLFSVDMARAESDLHDAVRKIRAPEGGTLAAALELVRRYQFVQVYRRISPFAQDALKRDEARRFRIETGLMLTMPDGTRIEALLVRPRAATAPLTTLLGFTIYANPDWAMTDAKTAAAHGYAGMVAYSRGKGLGDGPVMPFEHDGRDAAAVIDWIGGQAWSDGRVGMYGNSYNSFSQWSAAKHRPRALKAMMTSGSVAPGIDVPMQGNIFQNFMYPWPFYTTNNDTLDDATYGDQARWDALYHRWYAAGSPYRDMDALDGTPNPVFRRWLAHPAYDGYWQAMIPQGEEYAAIDFPVLAVTGYFDGGRVGVQHYYDQHTRHNPEADHTLLIGPFGHLAINQGVARQVDGYTLDRAALVDLQALRYQWFDHVFKGAEKPALLADRVNYQVMGGNEWKHAPSVQAMANGTLRLYLHAGGGGGENRLVRDVPSARSQALRVDFADRSDAGWKPAELAVTRELDRHNGVAYVGDVLPDGTEVSGLLHGRLAFTVNKRDVDLGVSLYEQTADGQYFLLSYHLGRASYARDRSRRTLLKPGARQQIDLRGERLVSRRLAPGSRLAVVVQVIKQADQQINYGTGGDVGDERIGDAGDPLEIRWHGDSYVDIPVWRQDE